MKYEFHYRIEKELEAATDELGNPAEAFAIFSFESDQILSTGKIKELHQGVCRTRVANGDEAMLPFVTPITKEDYEKEMDTDAPE